MERLLGSTTLLEHALLTSLRPLVKRSLSRRVHRHYRGFATSQQQALRAQPSAKKALYVLRTTLTGAYLLETGEMVTDVRQLLSRYGFEAAAALIEQKRRAERQPLDEATAGHWVRELVRAFQLLDGAAGASPLPSEPPNVEELDEWLIALRRGQLGAGLQWPPLPLSKEESV